MSQPASALAATAVTAEFPQRNPKTGKCNFYLPKKKRFCTGMRQRGQQFCAHHLTPENTIGEVKRPRVNCPLDPTHSVFADELSSHLIKCPVATRSARMERLPCYNQGCNLGGADTPDPVTDAHVAAELDSIQAHVKQLNMDGSTTAAAAEADPLSNNSDFGSSAAAQPSLPAEDEHAVGGVIPRLAAVLADSMDMRAFFRLVARWFTNHVRVIHNSYELPFVDSMIASAAFAEDKAKEEGPVRPRHIAQAAAIVGNMHRAGLLLLHNHRQATTCSPLFIELGAGRGQLSATLAAGRGLLELNSPRASMTTTRILLIDRQSCRRKVDNGVRFRAGIFAANAVGGNSLALEYGAGSTPECVASTTLSVSEAAAAAVSCSNNNLLVGDGDTVSATETPATTGIEPTAAGTHAEVAGTPTTDVDASVHLSRVRMDLSDFDLRGHPAAFGEAAFYHSPPHKSLQFSWTAAGERTVAERVFAKRQSRDQRRLVVQSEKRQQQQSGDTVSAASGDSTATAASSSNVPASTSSLAPHQSFPTISAPFLTTGAGAVGDSTAAMELGTVPDDDVTTCGAATADRVDIELVSLPVTGVSCDSVGKPVLGSHTAASDAACDSAGKRGRQCDDGSANDELSLCTDIEGSASPPVQKKAHILSQATQGAQPPRSNRSQRRANPHPHRRVVQRLPQAVFNSLPEFLTVWLNADGHDHISDSRMSIVELRARLSLAGIPVSTLNRLLPVLSTTAGVTTAALSSAPVSSSGAAVAATAPAAAAGAAVSDTVPPSASSATVVSDGTTYTSTSMFSSSSLSLPSSHQQNERAAAVVVGTGDAAGSTYVAATASGNDDSSAAPSAVVGIGKHLCGAATDIALKCLVNSLVLGRTAIVSAAAPNDIQAKVATAAAAAAAASASAVTTASLAPFLAQPHSTGTAATASATAPHDHSAALHGAVNARGGNDLPTSTSAALHGAAIATCCHHLCRWENYVGRSFFRDTLCATALQFEIMRIFSSWGVLDSGGDIGMLDVLERGSAEQLRGMYAGVDGAKGDAGDSGDVPAATTLPPSSDSPNAAVHSSISGGSGSGSAYGLPRSHRILLGRMCKRIIDEGRARFMENCGMGAPTSTSAASTPTSSCAAAAPPAPATSTRAQLVHYCPANLSPENCLLIVTSS